VFLQSCTLTQKATLIHAFLSTCVPFAQAVVLNVITADYTFASEEPDSSGIRVSIVMSRVDISDSIWFYYGTFSLNLDEMWKKPIESMLDKPGSLIGSGDITVAFENLKVHAGENFPFEPVDLGKTGQIYVYTNWVSDSLPISNYGLTPTHEYCYFNPITSSALLTGWIANTGYDPYCVDSVRVNLKAGFKNMCLMVKYMPITPPYLAQPPEEFVLNMHIPLSFNKTLTGKQLIGEKTN
jgi:hypothetical protein